MTGPVTTEALVDGDSLRDTLARAIAPHAFVWPATPASAAAALAKADALLAPLLAAHQQVTAERDEARNPFGNFTPTVERIALLMGRVWLEAKGAAGDTVADFEEFAMLAPEDCADCCTVAKAVLAAVDPAKANERADAAEASLATATSELARLRAEGEAKDRALKPFAEHATGFDWVRDIGREFPDDLKIARQRSGHTITLGNLRAARTALARATATTGA